MKGRESTRLSIRMRGGALGHHQALEKEERFSRFRSEEIGLIIWGLGSMAAERIFYGENTNGVGGDLQSVTAAAAWMVGASGMGPERVEIDHVMRRNGHPRKRLPAEVQRAEIMRRFEEIGIQIMNRASNGDVAHNADRVGARRPRQAAHGRADPRPGVHEGAPPDPLQQGQGRATSPTS